MTNLKDKIKNLGNWIKENPKKHLLGAGLTALIATTALKDNVHFGSVTLIDFQENQYTWGLLPTTEIGGKNLNGNIYTFGLIGGKNFLIGNSKLKGNMNAYGLVTGVNHLGNNSEITGDISNRGIIVNNSITGNSLGSNNVKGLKDYIYPGENKE